MGYPLISQASPIDSRVQIVKSTQRYSVIAPSINKVTHKSTRQVVCVQITDLPTVIRSQRPLLSKNFKGLEN